MAGGWYRDPARTGFPAVSGRIDQDWHWHEDERVAWHNAYLLGLLRLAHRGRPRGDPDDLAAWLGAPADLYRRLATDDDRSRLRPPT